MRRLYQIMYNSAVLLVVWLAVLLFLSITEMDTREFKMGSKSNIFQSYTFVVLQLPLHALVLFGSYSLCAIGYKLMTLADCDDAHAELVLQIDEARKDLKKRGVNLDAGLKKK